MNEMKKVERSIYSTEVDGATIMVARTPCSDLYDKLANIEFDLQSTKIRITPRGYLYRLPNQNNDCFIGLQSIPDNSKQYRLGTVFLRNFYTALDYD